MTKKEKAPVKRERAAPKKKKTFTTGALIPEKNGIAPETPGFPVAGIGMSTGDDLRKKAEAQIVANEESIRDPLSLVEANRLLHELQVHQIELEMQNDELRRTQTELEESRERYFDLYDLAPIGYLTVSKKGQILEANMTSAKLLGDERSALIKSPLSRFILSDDQDIYCRYRKQAVRQGDPSACELRMLRARSVIFWAHLQMTLTEHDVYRITLHDISERKQLDEVLREKTEKLEEAMSKIKVLSGLLPICMHCKKIRDENGHWSEIEIYISQHTDSIFSHGICNVCLNEQYPEQAKQMREDKRGMG